MIRAPLKLKMATSVLQDDEAAAMGDDGGDVGGHPSSPTAGTQSELNPKGQSDKGPSIFGSTAAVLAATGEGEDATFGAAPPNSGAEMLPKLELEVIAEASREVSVGDLEDEESSHLVDEAAAAKLAKSLPASADIAIRGEEAPAPAPLQGWKHRRVGET